ncbi:hypothetical protein BDZ94DRAFT_1374307 [Collybia nuda]|uniref:DUF6699 domain-containing protein n=1 Tax=Collybia nuda TaxID=64659 RepID=A0A9P6CCU0_9AGAR|nr:hypothetical protein BDZ94DRAFT_1374307 [Collybia nuda]
MWNIRTQPGTQPQLYPILPIYNGGHYLLLPPRSLYVNPWINAEAPRRDFIFDLSSTAYLPLRRFDNGHSSLLTPTRLSEAATLPALMCLRIVCDMIPEWPIDIDARNNRGSPPLILLTNVLSQIYKHMQRQILREDWEKLSLIARQEVIKQYTQRCTVAGSIVEQERASGIKQVDFLQGKTRMVGLLLDGEVNGLCIMKLIVTEKR